MIVGRVVIRQGGLFWFSVVSLYPRYVHFYICWWFVGLRYLASFLAFFDCAINDCLCLVVDKCVSICTKGSIFWQKFICNFKYCDYLVSLKLLP